jgi:hypothetical protein
MEAYIIHKFVNALEVDQRVPSFCRGCRTTNSPRVIPQAYLNPSNWSSTVRGLQNIHLKRIWNTWRAPAWDTCLPPSALTRPIGAEFLHPEPPLFNFPVQRHESLTSQKKTEQVISHLPIGMHLQQDIGRESQECRAAQRTIALPFAESQYLSLPWFSVSEPTTSSNTGSQKQVRVSKRYWSRTGYSYI